MKMRAIFAIANALCVAFAAIPASASDEQDDSGPSPRNQREWAAAIQANYPPMAMRNDEEGVVGMRITVGIDGRVADCVVVNSSGSEALDEGACRGMVDYAHYNPAVDDSGQPIEATTFQSVRYVIPQSGPTHFQYPVPVDEVAWRAVVFDDAFDEALKEAGQTYAAFQLVIDEAGKPNGCGVAYSTGDAQLDREGCGALLKHARFEPSRLDNGIPIPGAYWVGHGETPDF